jgi:hypothetical protein
MKLNLFFIRDIKSSFALIGEFVLLLAVHFVH